jgi:hypothetical protein
MDPPQTVPLEPTTIDPALLTGWLTIETSDKGFNFRNKEDKPI